MFEHLKTINIQRHYTMISSKPIHRIVVSTFLIETPTKGYIAYHIDTNRPNNRQNNLRFGTRLEILIELILQ